MNPMPRPAIDITGRRFGWLKVRYRLFCKNKHDALWFCSCNCGNTATKTGGYLRGNAKLGFRASCGCLKRAGLRLRHGHQRKGKTTRTYKTWASMIARCENSNEPVFKYYGGRGISVSKRWHLFDNFLKDMGVRPGKGREFTLDRKNVNGNYWKGNCRWATPLQQRHNQRKTL